MNATTPALLVAAAGVGLAHAIMPDHWVPLAVVGRARRYSVMKVARLSGLAGVAHVLVSILLGGVIIAVGLQFRSTIQGAQDTIVGLVLIATGVAFGALEIKGRGHGHAHSRRGHEHAHASHEYGHRHHPHVPTERGQRGHGLASVIVSFGAAASPDLTILPVFLAATAVGAGTAIGSLFAFAVATISTMVILTLLATVGGYRLRSTWLDRRSNLITSAVLLAIGGLVLAGVL